MIHVIDSLPRAITMLCRQMIGHARIEAYDDSTNTGYYLTIKMCPKPAAEMSAQELKRDMRRFDNPQPWDITVEEWEPWRYRGMNRGERSSKL